MGRDITPLGQHTLPFHDRKALMQELAKRFEANVYFGFPDIHGLAQKVFPTFKDRGVVNPEEGRNSLTYCILDEFIYAEHAKPLVLIQEEYDYHWLLEYYGEDVGRQKEIIKVWSSDPNENLKIIKMFAEESILIDLHFDGIFVILSQEAADVGLNEYFTGWTNLFYLITRTGYNFDLDFYKSLVEYRNTNRETILKLGGKCLYYHDCQGNNTGGAVQGNEWDMSWEEIEKAFNIPEAKKYQINLCEALTNEAYLKEVQEKTRDHFHDYSVFYDDLRELRWEDIIKP